MKAGLAILVAALAFAQSPAAAPDLILHNARIYTADAANRVAEAIVIRGGNKD